MLTKYKDVRPQKSVKSRLQNVFMSAAFQKIFKGGAPIVDIFSSVVFPAELF